MKYNTKKKKSHQIGTFLNHPHMCKYPYSLHSCPYQYQIMLTWWWRIQINYLLSNFYKYTFNHLGCDFIFCNTKVEKYPIKQIRYLNIYMCVCFLFKMCMATMICPSLSQERHIWSFQKIQKSDIWLKPKSMLFISCWGWLYQSISRQRRTKKNCSSFQPEVVCVCLEGVSRREIKHLSHSKSIRSFSGSLP